MAYSCELKNFRCEVFQDGCNIDCGLGSYAHFILGVVLQETLDTTARELDKVFVSIL